MKAIPKKQLMVMINNVFEDRAPVYMEDIIAMFEQFGDDWHVSGCEVKKSVDREKYRFLEFNI